MPVISTTELLSSLKSIRDEIPATVQSALFSNEKKIINLNQQQIYNGKNIFGEDIRPYYTEDPYFKTQNQALAYLAWKQRLTPNSQRNPDAPNLYINGFFYSLMRMKQEGENIIITVESGGTLGIKVTHKYDDILGLNNENQEKTENEILLPAIWELREKYI